MLRKTETICFNDKEMVKRVPLYKRNITHTYSFDWNFNLKNSFIAFIISSKIICIF